MLIPVTADNAPELMIRPLIVLPVVLADIVPLASTAKFVPSMTFTPVVSPKVRVPVPLA